MRYVQVAIFIVGPTQKPKEVLFDLASVAINFIKKEDY
jgi:hypothetical protein